MYQQMGGQQWRNPYTPAPYTPAPYTAVKPKPKKKKAPKPAATEKKPVDVIPPKEDSKNIKASLVKLKDQFKNVREQLVQMETAMETLHKVMDTMERFSGGTGNLGLRSNGNLLQTFNNIDFKQVMSLLQSPLVQAVLETMAEEETNKKK